MTRLKDDLALLNIQIKDKEQEIRICELKLKEITKANRTTHVQRVGNRRLTDKGRNETKTNRSPSAKLTNRNKSHNNISKPFPNVKFNNNSTDYKTKVNVFNKEEMLNQIENLSKLTD